MNIFLTGGTGFIGSHVAMELIANGHQVTILARNRNKIPAFTSIPQIELVEGDITDLHRFDGLLAAKDACIHVALNYKRRAGWQVLLDDTLPTVYLADAAARANVRHFIYTSSTAANDVMYMGGASEDEAVLKMVTATTKQHPATFYGATKAASENYVIAQSHLAPMRVAIIRPGYTFGNPVVDGAPTQGDTRFRAIIKAALAGETVKVIKNDGTQFIWAGHLARLYASVLHSTVNRKTYFGLSRNFISWEAIAREAVTRCGSKSDIVVEDRGWSDEHLYWDVSDMQRDFGLAFDPWEKLCEHLDYTIDQERAN